MTVDDDDDDDLFLGVEWRSSEVRWASRWDVYLSMNHAIPDKVRYK